MFLTLSFLGCNIFILELLKVVNGFNQYHTALGYVSEAKYVNVIGVTKPRRSQMVWNVPNYIMLMRFLQFLIIDDSRSYAR